MVGSKIDDRPTIDNTQQDNYLAGMTEFLKRYWFGIVGVLIGFLVAFYFQQKSIYEREPVFLLDSARTEIINKKIISETSVRVIKSDGTEVTDDLTALRFYFWNDGKKPIKKEDILEPLYLQLSDSSSEILDYRVLKLSRGVTGFQLSRDKLKEKNVLLIDFRILEKDDGITGQIIYSGNPNSMLLMKGTIEGVKLIRSKIQKQKQFSLVFTIFLAIIVIPVSMFGGYFGIKDDALKKVKKKIVKNFILVVYLSICVIIMILFWRKMYFDFFEIGNIPTGIVP